MSEKSGIAWTDATWNPWRGCTKVSEGCDHCYMYREQERYGNKASEIMLAGNRTFNMPRRLKPGTMVFTCSWSDFFHEAADEWRQDAWNIMHARQDLIFQICTKRIERVERCLPPDWPFPNVWLGVTAENQKRADERIPQLLEIPAALHWLSIEPMLSEIVLRHTGMACSTTIRNWLSGGYARFDSQTKRRHVFKIGWVIVGGESGPGARTMELAWARSVRDQCREANTPFFMKQVGGWPNKLDKMADFPEDLRIREFPQNGQEMQDTTKS